MCRDPEAILPEPYHIPLADLAIKPFINSLQQSNPYVIINLFF